MTEIERKALALAIEVREDDKMRLCPDPTLTFSNWEALCRAIEQHEAFKQEVSDAVEAYSNAYSSDEAAWEALKNLIIPKPKPKPKPDSLVDVWGDLFIKSYNLDQFCDALEARGFEIREKGQ
jgi:hypothetical protein